MQLTTEAAGDKTEQEGRVALHDALVEAIRLITPKELCFRLGITQQYLSEAVHNLNRKGFRADWLVTVVMMAPSESVAAILRALGNLRNFEVQRRKVLSPEEENREMRNILKREAPGVLALVDKELGR